MSGTDWVQGHRHKWYASRALFWVFFFSNGGHLLDPSKLLIILSFVISSMRLNIWRLFFTISFYVFLGLRLSFTLSDWLFMQLSSSIHITWPYWHSSPLLITSDPFYAQIFSQHSYTLVCLHIQWIMLASLFSSLHISSVFVVHISLLYSMEGLTQASYDLPLTLEEDLLLSVEVTALNFLLLILILANMLSQYRIGTTIGGQNWQLRQSCGSWESDT